MHALLKFISKLFTKTFIKLNLFFWLILFLVLIRYLFLFNNIFNNKSFNLLDKSLSRHSKEMQLSGEVIGLPDNIANNFNNNNFNNNKLTHFLFKTKLGILRLSWYNPEKYLKTGEKWKFWLKLKKLHSLKNPNLPNSVFYWRMQGIVASGYVLNKSKRHTSTYQLLFESSEYLPQAWRGILQSQIKSYHLSFERFILALGIGDRSGLSSSDWQILQRDGVSHLLAISGMHIGLIALLIGGLARIIFSLTPWVLYIESQKVGWLFAFASSLLYGEISGWPVSAIRAAIMLSVFALGVIFCIASSLLERLIIAFLLVLLIQPESIFAAGFWLSFAAVLVLCILSSNHNRDSIFADPNINSNINPNINPNIYLKILFYIYKYLKDLIILQLVFLISLMPLSAFFFGQYSFISIPANLIAIPIISCIVLPFIFIGILGLCILPSFMPILANFKINFAQVCFDTANFFFQKLWFCLDKLSNLPFSGFIARPSCFLFLISIFGVAMFLCIPGCHCETTSKQTLAKRVAINYALKTIGLLLILPIFFYNPIKIPYGKFKTIVLDVGQGLSVVIFTHKKVFVYDTGPRFINGFDAGKAVLVPYLRSMGVKNIDTVIISHGDNDHIGGFNYLNKNLKINKIYTSFKGLLKNPNTNNCNGYHNWKADGVEFDLFQAPDQISKNNRSCVLRITNAYGKSILITGDIEKQAELGLLNNYPEYLKSDVLVAPHHGSKSSSSIKFIRKVSPRKVVFATGFQNKFKFPNKSVVRRYKRLGVRMQDTGGLGAVDIE